MSPQPTLAVAGTPQRVTTTDLWVRAAILESADGNTDKMYVADSEAKASTSNRHLLKEEGDYITMEVDQYGNLEGAFNLKDVWFDGAVSGEKLVVSYLAVVGDLE